MDETQPEQPRSGAEAAFSAHMAPFVAVNPGRSLTGRRNAREAVRGTLDDRLNRLHASRVAQGLLKVHEYEDVLAFYSARLDREPKHRDLAELIDRAIAYRPARLYGRPLPAVLPPAKAGSALRPLKVSVSPEFRAYEVEFNWDKGLPKMDDSFSVHARLVDQKRLGEDASDARPDHLMGHSAHGRYSCVGAVCAHDRAHTRRPNREGFQSVGEFVDPDCAKQWAGALAEVEDTFCAAFLLGISELYDCTTQTAVNKVRRAARAVLGMPRMLSMVRAGELSFDRLEYAVRASCKLRPELMPTFDEKIAACRASKMVYFRRAVNELIAALMTDEERNEDAFSRRRVVTHHNANGTSELTLVGPTHAIALLEARLDGMAKAIRKGQLSGFDEQLPKDHVLLDARTLEQLKFDLMVGALIGTESPCAPAAEVGGEFLPGEEPGRTSVRFTCPTDAEWLRRQARVNITVPMMTLLSEDADVPGSINGIPINPEAARRIVGSGPKTAYRILTDPETGAVRDSQAQNYTIPEPMRVALVEKWQYCTAPGCHQPARKAELDHQRPFDHKHPAAGGLTTMKNLHPLCKLHHQLKTEGVLRLATSGRSDLILWEMEGRECAPVTVPESLLGVLNAEHFAAMAEGRLPNPSPEPVRRIPDRSDGTDRSSGDDDPDDQRTSLLADRPTPPAPATPPSAGGPVTPELEAATKPELETPTKPEPRPEAGPSNIFDMLGGEPEGGWQNSADPPPF